MAGCLSLRCSGFGAVVGTVAFGADVADAGIGAAHEKRQNTGTLLGQLVGGDGAPDGADVF